jgi:hypothetical protein
VFFSSCSLDRAHLISLLFFFFQRDAELQNVREEKKQNMSVFSKIFSGDEKSKFKADKAANMVQQEKEAKRAKEKRSAKPKGLKNRF